MIKLKENCDLKGCTAIIPSVCVGNVGQLTADLLISSLNLKKIGYVWHESILAVAGADPFGNSNELSTACELFYSKTLNLIVLQIRSAFVKNKSGFLDELCSWLKSNGVKQVVILSGISAHERKDKQLIGEPLRYVFCPLTKEENLNDAKNRNWIELENKEENIESSFSFTNYIPGAGIAVKLYKKCVSEKIPSSILFEFCLDGNNIPDSIKLADYLNEWLQVKEKLKINSWVIPPSWDHLFGPLPPIEIF